MTFKFEDGMLQTEVLGDLRKLLEGFRDGYEGYHEEEGALYAQQHVAKLEHLKEHGFNRLNQQE